MAWLAPVLLVLVRLSQHNCRNHCDGGLRYGAVSPLSAACQVVVSCQTGAVEFKKSQENFKLDNLLNAFIRYINDTFELFLLSSFTVDYHINSKPLAIW